MNSFDIAEQMAKIIALLGVPVVLAIGGWYIQKGISEKALHKDYVSLAVSILAKPKEESDPKLRAWAVDLLNNHSPVKLDFETSQNLATGDLTLPNGSISGPSYRNAPIKHNRGEILILESPAIAGRCVVDIDYGTDFSASYRWRYRKPGSEEVSGSGNLFEQFIKVDTLNYPMGRTIITAGPFGLEWSYAGPSSGWIYSLPPTKVFTTQEKSFADFKL